MKHSIKQLIVAVLAAACTAVSCDSYFDINTKDQATLESHQRVRGQCQEQSYRHEYR